MIIIGYDMLPYKSHYKVASINDIHATPPNATLHLAHFNEELMAYMKQNSLCYSVVVQNKTELILANAYEAAYIITDDPKSAQNIATDYLFDAKILTFVTKIDQIEKLVDTGVDGIIFAKAIL